VTLARPVEDLGEGAGPHTTIASRHLQGRAAPGRPIGLIPDGSAREQSGPLDH